MDYPEITIILKVRYTSIIFIFKLIIGQRIIGLILIIPRPATQTFMIQCKKDHTYNITTYLRNSLTIGILL
jgi:hypothetical protein